MWIFWTAMALWVGIYALQSALFRRTTYYSITHNSFYKTVTDKGRYGEYLTYRRLKSLEKDGGKFLFNIYLKKDEEKTTEVDVLLIHKKGIFVFESKNYSGWIFGNERQKNWVQTLPQGKGKKALKTYFLNPIAQNSLHIKALKNVIGEELPVYSVVVFSERCTLKDIKVTDSNIPVIKRQNVLQTIKTLSTGTDRNLSAEEIVNVYTQLYPMTQVSEEVKKKHIEDIKAGL